MRFVEFFRRDQSIVVVNPNTVESLHAMEYPGDEGPYTSLRFTSGQLEIVKGSLGNTVENLNYGEQYE